VKRSSPQAAVASSEDNVTLSRSRRRTSSNDASVVGGRHSLGATSEPELWLDELNGWLIRFQILIAGLIAHDERDARYERDARSADRQWDQVVETAVLPSRVSTTDRRRSPILLSKLSDTDLERRFWGVEAGAPQRFSHSILERLQTRL
jgi:hypothetical protein